MKKKIIIIAVIFTMDAASLLLPLLRGNSKSEYNRFKIEKISERKALSMRGKLK